MKIDSSEADPVADLRVLLSADPDLLDELDSASPVNLDAYAEGCIAARDGDFRRAADLWIPLLDLDGGLPAAFAAGMIREAADRLLAVADEGFREDPDLGPVGDILLALHSGSLRSRANELQLDILNLLGNEYTDTEERSYASRLAYVNGLFFMQVLRTAPTLTYQMSLAEVLSRTWEEVSELKGARVTPRLRPACEFMQDLAAAIRSSDPGDYDNIVNTSQAWKDAGFEDMHARLEEIRRMYVAGGIDRAEGRELLSEYVGDYLDIEPADSDYGTDCVRCRRWSPVDDDAPWKCPWCGCDVHEYDPRAMPALLRRAIAGCRPADIDRMLESFAEDEVPEWMALDAEACALALDGCLPEAFLVWQDALLAEGCAEDAVVGHIADCLRSFVLDGGKSRLHVDFELVPMLFKAVGDPTALSRTICDTVLEGDCRFNDSQIETACICLLSAVAASESREDSTDTALHVYMAVEGLPDRFDPVSKSIACDLLDALYMKLDGMPDASFLSSRRDVRQLQSHIYNMSFHAIALIDCDVREDVDRFLSEEGWTQGPSRRLFQEEAAEDELMELDGMGMEELEEQARTIVDSDDDDPAPLLAMGTRMIDLDPEDHRGWMYRGYYQILSNSCYGEACRDWARAVELMPADSLVEFHEDAVIHIVASCFLPDIDYPVPDGCTESGGSDLILLADAFRSRDPSFGDSLRIVREVFLGLSHQVETHGSGANPLATVMAGLVVSVIRHRPDMGEIMNALYDLDDLLGEMADVDPDYHDDEVQATRRFTGCLINALEPLSDPETAKIIREAWDDDRYRELAEMLDTAWSHVYDMIDPFHSGVRLWDRGMRACIGHFARALRSGAGV